MIKKMQYVLSPSDLATLRNLISTNQVLIDAFLDSKARQKPEQRRFKVNRYSESLPSLDKDELLQIF